MKIALSVFLLVMSFFINTLSFSASDKKEPESTTFVLEKKQLELIIKKLSVCASDDTCTAKIKEIAQLSKRKLPFHRELKFFHKFFHYLGIPSFIHGASTGAYLGIIDGEDLACPAGSIDVRKIKYPKNCGLCSSKTQPCFSIKGQIPNDVYAPNAGEVRLGFERASLSCVEEVIQQESISMTTMFIIFFLLTAADFLLDAWLNMEIIDVDHFIDALLQSEGSIEDTDQPIIQIKPSENKEHAEIHGYYTVTISNRLIPKKIRDILYSVPRWIPITESCDSYSEFQRIEPKKQIFRHEN